MIPRGTVIIQSQGSIDWPIEKQNIRYNGFIIAPNIEGNLVVSFPRELEYSNK